MNSKDRAALALCERGRERRHRVWIAPGARRGLPRAPLAPRRTRPRGAARRACSFALLACIAALLPFLFPKPGSGQVAVPPDLAYRTLHSERVRVTFPAGKEAIAQRVARRAEEVYNHLASTFLDPPVDPVDILLTDHADIVNGTAFATPSSRITIWLQPPLDGMARSYFEDWIDSVVLHEMAHIFHFELAGPPGRILREILGRAPNAWPYFPATALPRFLVEGIGVHLESLHTTTGRADGTSFESMLRAQWLELGPERLDQGLGRSPLWTGGEREYVYGSHFLAYLTDRYGEGAVRNFLAEIVDLWIPYRLDPAARNAFGHSMEELWAEWVDSVMRKGEALRDAVAARALHGEVERLTFTGGMALYPHPAPGGEVVYIRSDARSDLQLRIWSPDGDHFLALSNTGITPPRWTPGGEIVFPQLEFVDSHRAFQDLFLVDRDGEARQLTSGARVLHADPHPGGEGYAAAVAAGELTRLVLLDAGGREVRVLREAEEGILWSHPAWSPDGRRIAVARRRPGGWTGILLLDVDGSGERVVVEDRSLNTFPAWGPLGETLLWGSDRNGVANLMGVRLEESGVPGQPLQITDLVGGGIFPAVDPEGDWIYFSFLTGIGWEVARLPYDPEGWFEPLPMDPRFDEGAGGAAGAAAGGTGAAGDGAGGEGGGAGGARGAEAAGGGVGALLASTATPWEWELRDYSPFPTLAPQYWLPIRREGASYRDREVLPSIWGIELTGADLIRRHEFSLHLLAPLRTPRERVEWTGGYIWAGLGNPIVRFDANRAWSYRGRMAIPESEGEFLDALQAESSAGIAIDIWRRRIRQSAFLSIGGRWILQERLLRDEAGEDSDRISLAVPRARLGELGINVGWSSARAFPFSVSLESGLSLSLGFRERWHLSLPGSLAGIPGADASFREITGSLQGYLPVSGPGYARHILALRVAGGAARGPGAGSGHFGVGGSSGLFPIRGFPAGERFGEWGWSVSGEWRFPIRILHRGFGPWPLYLDRLAGSVFFDFAGAGGGSAAGAGASGGSANGSGAIGGQGGDAIGSAGVEILLNYLPFFWNVEQIAVGVAAGTLAERGVSVYVRYGWAF